MTPRRTAELLSRLELGGIKLSLDTTRRLLAAFGDPQHEVPTVLVAGTNGKGSTAALLAAMGTAAGYRTGLYSSPHLEDVEERIRLDGRAIGGEPFGELLDSTVRRAEGRLGQAPTYFEALTLVACRYFAAEGADLQVLEVGMGGRLDATNTCEPRLSVITPIARDHTAELGDTLTAIAAEKAGILRPRTPVVLGRQPREAAAALERAIAQIGALPVRANWTLVRGDAGSLSLIADGRRHAIDLALAGEHQVDNLETALAAAETLADRGLPRLAAAAAAAGACACRWPGRFERVPLGDGRHVVLDAGHNAAALEALRLGVRARHRPYRLLFGTLRDKDPYPALRSLAESAEEVVLTEPQSDRAQSAKAVAERLAGLELTLEPDVGRALEWALRQPAADRSVTEVAPVDLVVCGSFYLVGAVRQLLRTRLGRPPRAAEVSTYELTGTCDS